MYDKPVANIVLSSGIRQGYAFLTILFTVVLKILEGSIRQEKQKKTTELDGEK